MHDALTHFESVISVIFIFALIPGAVLNITVAVLLWRRYRQHPSAYPIIFGFTTCIIDALTSGSLMISYCAKMIPMDTQDDNYISHFRCSVRHFSLVFMCIGLRAIINMYIAGFNFMRLLYPFTHIPMGVNRKKCILAIVALILASWGFWNQFFEHKFDQKKKICESCYSSGLKAHHTFTMLVRLSSLFVFVQNYLFPMSALVYFYHKLLVNLSNKDDLMKTAMKGELSKNLHLDGYMCIIMFGFVHIVSFWSEFMVFKKLKLSSLAMDMMFFSVGIYGNAYLIISIYTRRVYKAASEPLRREISHLLNRKMVT